MDMLKTKDHRTFKEYVKNEAAENLKFHNDIEKTKEKTYNKVEVDNENIVNSSVVCSNCGTSLDKTSKFCSSCGEKVFKKEPVPTCPECKTTYEIGTRFCSNDGKELELI